MRTEIASGLRFVWHHPILRPSMIFIAISNFFTNAIFAIAVVYAVRVLHLSAPTIGLIFAVSNIGSLLGTLTGIRLARRFGIGPTLVGLAAFGGFSLLLIPLASGSVAIPFLTIGYLVFSYYAFVYRVVSITLYQAVTPEHLLGRMNASRRFVVWGVIPFGSLTGGALASTVGIRTAIWVGAVGAAVAFIPLLRSPIRSIRSNDDAEELVRSINEKFATA
jgi:predicted MFS family arabinose efflux permease